MSGSKKVIYKLQGKIIVILHLKYLSAFLTRLFLAEFLQRISGALDAQNDFLLDGFEGVDLLERI